MEKILTKYNFIFISIILAIIFVFPFKVNALSYMSDYIALEDSVELETDEFVMDLEYKVNTEKQSSIVGYSLKKTSNTYYYHYIICYFNVNKEEIGATDGYNYITNRMSNYSSIKQKGNSISSSLESKNMYSNHLLSEIKYYKVFIEPSTSEITNRYLYQNNKKLNDDGIDDITDYNIISMKTTNLKDGTNNFDFYNEGLKPSQNSQYRSYDYVIDKYDINIVVNENNTFDITETITAYFNVSKHGIFRTLPLKNTITRLDGTSSKNKVQISNLSVNNEYTTSRKNGIYKIKIGSPSYTVTGSQTYVIRYTYNIGKDPIKSYDELYYNIIGTGWDTVIGNVTFEVTMPKEFDSSKLGFSSGKLGSTDNSNVEYHVFGNKILGSYNDILEVGEALTIRCELPEGYFVGAGLTINFMDYIMFIMPIIFLIISILLWYIFGRDDKVIDTVEFYPPEGFNSLEVGFLYKGKAENQDVTSLIIYLANKGYIKISEIEVDSLFGKSKDFKITKLKEYDGNNINEYEFLNGLFTKQVSLTKRASSTSLFSKTPELPTYNISEVTSMDLYDKFYTTIKKILNNINDKKNKNKIFEKSTSSKNVFIVLMIIATYYLTTIPSVLAYGDINFIIAGLSGLPVMMFAFMFNALLSFNGTIYASDDASRKLLKADRLTGCVFSVMGWCLAMVFILPALIQDSIYLVGYIIGLGCISGMLICIKYLPKRTPYGNEILGKLKGFKNFLEMAEKDRLEAMVMQNPSYFYDILPYTYVLGVSDKWINKFESITLQAPSWYDSESEFDFTSFGSFMSNTMSSAESAMSSTPSSGSDFGGSGGDSGGGSSGGGSGGGGGGSW